MRPCFYQGDNLEATIGYRFSSNQLEEIEAFGISQFQQGRGFLDLDIEYQLPETQYYDRLTLFFSANDLTDTGRRFSVFETRGESEAFSDLATFNGRTFTFGFRSRF